MLPVMMSRFLAGTLGVVLGLLPVIPPEHLHEAEEEGHVQAVVHRHLKPHGIFDHHDADHRPTLDDDDGPVLTLTTLYDVPGQLVVASPPRIVGASIEPPALHQRERLLADVEILIHGPPRSPTHLRAPPFSPAT
jgi:hypothetical protein